MTAVLEPDPLELEEELLDSELEAVSLELEDESLSLEVPELVVFVVGAEAVASVWRWVLAAVVAPSSLLDPRASDDALVVWLEVLAE